MKNISKNSSCKSQCTLKSPGKIYEEIEKEMTNYSTKIKYSLLKTKKEIYENMKINNKFQFPHFINLFQMI